MDQIARSSCRREQPLSQEIVPALRRWREALSEHRDTGARSSRAAICRVRAAGGRRLLGRRLGDDIGPCRARISWRRAAPVSCLRAACPTAMASLPANDAGKCPLGRCRGGCPGYRRSRERVLAEVPRWWRKPSGWPAKSGIVGGSIEDTTGDRSALRSCRSVWPWNGFAPRPRQRAACRSRFALTARADQYMHNQPDLAATIQTGTAIPGGRRRYDFGAWIGRTNGEIETLCRSVDCPVAVVVGLVGRSAGPRNVRHAWRPAGDCRKFVGAGCLYRVAQRSA